MEECCVLDCDYKTHDNLTFFKFPTSVAQHRKWVAAVGRSCVPSAALVCSRHFRKEEMTVSRGRVRLKPRVVPSVFSVGVHSKSEHTDPVSPVSRTCEIEKKENDITDTTENPKTTEPSPTITIRTLRKRNCNGLSLNQLNYFYTDSESQSESDSDSHSESENRTKRRKNYTKKCSKRNQDSKKACDKSKVKEKDSGKNKEEEESPKQTNGVVEDKNENREAYKTDSAPEDHSGGCNILVTPSIEFFCNHDDAAAPEPEAARPDIEDILTNYQIAHNHLHLTDDPEDLLAGTVIKTTDKNKTKLDAVTEENSESNKAGSLTSERTELTTNGRAEISTNGIAESQNSEAFTNGVNSDGNSKTQFLEVSVGENKTANDCLLLLEVVQVDVDPAALLQQNSDDVHVVESVEEPISLVTSSDESDVILQEPHIDTVEVSSADEDDEPLTKLVGKDVSKSWPSSFFCYNCKYTTKSKTAFKKHIKIHDNSDIVYLMCDACDYTTSSRRQLARHKRSHQYERKYKCHLCAFRAKHKMSLTYHLREHDKNIVREKVYVCHTCGTFETNSEGKIERHWKTCKGHYVAAKRFNCDKCDYKTNRKHDMDRHVKRKHKSEINTSDSEE